MKTLRGSATVADNIYRLLKKEIVTGELKPGALVQEADLARRYEAGRTPVREALKRLQSERLVEAIPRAGYLITPVTTKDVHEVFELRLILETAAARLAAKNASDEALARLRDFAEFEYIYGDRASYQAFLARNTEFHYMVAVNSQNERLAVIVRRLLQDLERLFHLELDVRDSAGEMVEEHKALVAALVERDPEKASSVMAAQIRASMERVLEALVGTEMGFHR